VGDKLPGWLWLVRNGGTECLSIEGKSLWRLRSGLAESAPRFRQIRLGMHPFGKDFRKPSGHH
jgi:hypothetical protein